MKKWLLLAVLLCVAVGVRADFFTQQVTAKIEPMIQIEWPDAEFSFGDLVAGPNETPVMPLKVISNIPYELELSTESICLKEFIPEQGTYGEITMMEPLKVSIDGGSTWKTLAKHMVLAEQTAISGIEDIYNLKYQQVFRFPGDKALSEGRVYKTDITLRIIPMI